MQRLKYMLKDMGIITRNPLVAIEIKLDNTILKLISNLNSVLDVNSGDKFEIIKLDNYVEIIVDQDKLEEVTKLIPKGYIQALRPELCEITFLLNKKTPESKELFKEIYSELIDNDVEVVQTISNNSGFTVLVDKIDFPRLNKLINSISY